MKKILVMLNDKNDFDAVLKKDIAGIILPVEHLAVNSGVYYSLEEIREISSCTEKEVCVSVNKIMMNKDLELLEYTLKELAQMKISKILFYDLAVLNLCKKLKIGKELVVFQDHLNANMLTNTFYKNRGVSYSVITNDLTKEEINEIGKHQRLMMVCYGYLPIFYSRRYLISNYLEYLGRDKLDVSYYLKHDNDQYIIEEEEEGTTIYTKMPINLINEVDDLDIDYVILNSYHIEKDTFMNILDQFIGHKKSNDDVYLGFLNKRTVYKVEDYE